MGFTKRADAKSQHNYARRDYVCHRVFEPGRTSVIGEEWTLQEARRLIESSAAALAPDEQGVFVVVRKSRSRIVAAIGLDQLALPSLANIKKS